MSEGIKDAMQDVMETEQEDAAMEAVRILTTDDEEGSVDLKTDIPDSLRLSFLTTLSEFFDKQDFEKSANFLKKLVSYYKRYQVSKDRQSRKEVIQALQSVTEEEDSAEDLKEALTTE